MEILTYLTAKLERGFPFAKEVANRLNDKGIAPKRSPKYTRTVVENAIYGRTEDENVKHELMLMVAEREGKTGIVAAHINAARAILGV